MKPISHIAAACGAALVLTSASHAFAADDPIGVWMDDTGRGAVEIKTCGANLCGYVVAVKSQNDTKGCGKQIIGDAKPVSGGRWDQGWIYSPERRKNYDVELKPMTDGNLRVVGYAGTKLFSRTMIWKPAPADLKRCDAQPADAPPVVTPPATAPAVEANASATSGKPTTVTPAPETAKPAPQSSETQKPDVATTDAPTANDTVAAQPGDTEVAAKSDDGGEAPGERGSSEGIKLGGLDLDKVLKRTASGKCKLDLPWVKVQFDCPQE